MAGVVVQKIGTASILPGATHEWWWNNAAAERVWSFSVDVRPLKWTAIFAPVTLKVEVTRVEYHLRFPSVSQQEREVHCWVKNTGTVDAVYELRMAVAPSGGSTVVGTSVQPYFSNVVAAINTSASFTKVQNFDPPRRLTAFPVLQRVTETDDQSNTVAFISEFVDGGTTKVGPFTAISGAAVSKIVWGLECADSANNPLRVVLFFD